MEPDPLQIKWLKESPTVSIHFPSLQKTCSSLSWHDLDMTIQEQWVLGRLNFVLYEQWGQRFHVSLFFCFYLLHGTDPQELAFNSLLISDISFEHLKFNWLQVGLAPWMVLVILSFWNNLSFLPQGAAPGLCLQTKGPHYFSHQLILQLQRSWTY